MKNSNLKLWLKEDRFKVVGFYPYTSHTMLPIISQIINLHI